VAYNVKNRGFCPGIAVVFTVLAVLVMAGGAGALSNDGGGSWQYYRAIFINNTSGADVRLENGSAEFVSKCTNDIRSEYL